MTVRQFISQAANRLKEHGIDSPRLSAEIIACHALALSRLDLFTMPEREMNASEISKVEGVLLRRLAGEPVAMIVGGKEFYGLFFAVSSATLVPRPETELMIDEVLKRFAASPQIFMDLGTGSGCIAVTLAAERREWRGIMADISAAALAVAISNAARHNALVRLYPVLGDMSTTFVRHGSLDFIVSNPPYVTEDEYPLLSHEVRGFEPRSALVSSKEGLWHIEALARHALPALKPGGFLFVEHGYAQGEAVRNVFNKIELCGMAETVLDYAGHERLCVIRKK